MDEQSAFALGGIVGGIIMGAAGLLLALKPAAARWYVRGTRRGRGLAGRVGDERAVSAVRWVFAPLGVLFGLGMFIYGVTFFVRTSAA